MELNPARPYLFDLEADSVPQTSYVVKLHCVLCRMQIFLFCSTLFLEEKIKNKDLNAGFGAAALFLEMTHTDTIKIPELCMQLHHLHFQ